MRLPRHPRPGATTLEMAVACPVAFLLLFAILIGGLGVFRYQQLAALAREATRYAAVHGGMYQKESRKPAATAQDIYREVIAARATCFDLNNLTYAVTWDQNNYPYRTAVVNGQVTATTNTVTVSLTYRWIPEAFLGGVTMTSSSTLPVSY